MRAAIAAMPDGTWRATTCIDGYLDSDCSTGPAGMNLPGFRLHELEGRMKGHYAVSVPRNWRVTFRFEDGEAVDVHCVDCY